MSYFSKVLIITVLVIGLTFIVFTLCSKPGFYYQEQVRKSEDVRFSKCVKEVSYKNHQYIKYDLYQTHIIIHSPDCNCLTNKVER